MLEIGSLIDGKYKILNKIGQGGMSVVYLAMNEKANKQWAIKEVRKDGIKDFDVVKQGLIMETDLLKRFNHSNLPSIIDVIEDENTFLIVMDYIQGNPLNKALEEFGAQPQDFVIEWAKQLCDVLGYLHTCTPPIIYRDMKPANVMLKPDGNLTLVDFGTAREFKEKNLADTTCLGTIGYAAPEQFGGLGQTDVRTDIYCLGATLYHLVTGYNPCEPPYEMLPIRQINPSLSGGLERIISKCTQRNPGDRYQSCSELMYALEHYEQIDDLYKKKQKKKLRAFIGTVVMATIFFGTSIFGYVSGENKKSDNYDIMLAFASDAQKTQSERIEDYLGAIEINQTDTRAYLELIQLFLSSDEQTGSFTKEESSVITQLLAGIDIQDSSGYSKTIFPLDELSKNNKLGYSEVCYEIGMAYWYDYSVESDRYSASVGWFTKAVQDYPIAQIYCDIGDCQQQIKKYAGQNRTQMMYEAYETLWDKLILLETTAATLADNDTKLLAWSEIIRTASAKVSYFVVNIKSDEILLLLDRISDEATKLSDTTKYEDIKVLLEKLLVDIENARIRVGSATEYKEQSLGGSSL